VAANDELKAEVERLRAEVEGYRTRELEQLRAQLAQALADLEHYRAEAQRNADVGRAIYAESQAEIMRLQQKLDAQVLPNARTIGRGNSRTSGSA